MRTQACSGYSPHTSRDVDLLHQGQLGHESLSLLVSLLPTDRIGVHPGGRVVRLRWGHEKNGGGGGRCSDSAAIEGLSEGAQGRVAGIL
jgi:hypothetical protein